MATGDIGSVLATLEFDIARCDNPSVCHISGDVYACAYTADDLDGFLVTFSIDSSDGIPCTFIDSWEFNPTEAEYCSIVYAAPGYVAIAYATSGGVARIDTIAVTAGGTITESIHSFYSSPVIDGIEYMHFIHVTGNIYAWVFDHSVDGLVCKTIDIVAGTLGASFLDTLIIEPAGAYYPWLCHVGDDIYGCVFSRGNRHGYLKTFSISFIGQISDTVIDTFEYDTVVGEIPTMAMARSGYCAIAYHDGDGHGWLKTLLIYPSGLIDDTLIDSYEFGPSDSSQNHVISFGMGYIAVASVGPDTDGWIKTFLVDITGHLNSTTLDSLEFDADDCQYPFLFHLTGNIFAIAYQGVDLDGWLCSLDITVPSAEVTQHLMMIGVG